MILPMAKAVGEVVAEVADVLFVRSLKHTNVGQIKFIKPNSQN